MAWISTMNYKVTLNDDVIHVTEQTGKSSDFYETTFTFYVADWPSLKSLIDSTAFFAPSFAWPDSQFKGVTVTSRAMKVEDL